MGRSFAALYFFTYQLTNMKQQQPQASRPEKLGKWGQVMAAYLNHRNKGNEVSVTDPSFRINNQLTRLAALMDEIEAEGEGIPADLLINELVRLENLLTGWKISNQ